MVKNMKWIKKVPSVSDKQIEQHLKAGWRPVHQRSMISTMILGIPFMFALGVTSIALAIFLDPSWTSIFQMQGTTVDALLVVLLLAILWAVTIFLHEFIHAIVTPNWKSDKVMIGMNGMYGFAYTNQELSKARYIFIALTPCLISFLVLIAFGATNTLHAIVVFLCFMNAGGSAGDIVLALIALFKVPNGAKLKVLPTNNEAILYFKV